MNISEYERGKVPKIIRDGKLIYGRNRRRNSRKNFIKETARSTRFEWVEDHLL